MCVSLEPEKDNLNVCAGQYERIRVATLCNKPCMSTTTTCTMSSRSAALHRDTTEHRGIVLCAPAHSSYACS
jgi:hypothetical protein